MGTLTVAALVTSLAIPPLVAQDRASDAVMRNGRDEATSARGGSLVVPALPDGARFLAVGHDRHNQRAVNRNRGWAIRHPALLGALVGAGVGTVASMTMENELFCSGGDEDCFFHGGGRAWVGAGLGAGVGALVGWIAGLGSD